MKKALLFLAGLAVSASAFAGVDKLYGVGQIEGWGNFASGAVGQELTKTSDGVFTWSGEVTKTAYIAFASELGDWNTLNSHRFSPATKDAPMVVGDNAMVANVDTSWKLLPGNYSMTIDTNKMICTLSEQGSVELVYTYDIHGQLDGLGDSDWQDYALTAENDDLWTGTFTPSVSGGYFGVRQLCNGSQSDWYAAGVSFDEDNSSYVLAGDPEGNCTLDFPANTQLTFSFVPSTQKLTISAATAIAGVEIEAAPAEYFNMQGVRVAEPAHGLYIVRQGSKVSKVVR